MSRTETGSKNDQTALGLSVGPVRGLASPLELEKQSAQESRNEDAWLMSAEMVSVQDLGSTLKVQVGRLAIGLTAETTQPVDGRSPESSSTICAYSYIG